MRFKGAYRRLGAPVLKLGDIALLSMQVLCEFHLGSLALTRARTIVAATGSRVGGFDPRSRLNYALAESGDGKAPARNARLQTAKGGLPRGGGFDQMDHHLTAILPATI